MRRIHDPVDAADGARILVDRVWPRGVRRADAGLDLWARDAAPGVPLRKWFGHAPERFEAFAAAYRRELDARPEAVARLLEWVRRGDVTLLYAARDRTRNHARVLAEYLDGCR